MAVIDVKGREPNVSTSDGHGYDTSGKETPALPQRNGQRMKEKEFNEAVQNYLAEELARCGIRHKDVAPGRTDVPLSARVKASDDFEADLHVEIHANAFNGILDDKAGGIETFYYPSPKSVDCAEIIHKHVMGGSKLKDRGIKNGGWLYMLKNTKAVAVLVELGFMDNKTDVDFLLSDDYRRECAMELAKAICEIFGKSYVPKPKPSSKTLPKEESKSSVQIVEVTEGITLYQAVRVLKKGERYKKYGENVGMEHLGGGLFVPKGYTKVIGEE